MTPTAFGSIHFTFGSLLFLSELVSLAIVVAQLQSSPPHKEQEVRTLVTPSSMGKQLQYAACRASIESGVIWIAYWAAYPVVL